MLCAPLPAYAAAQVQTATAAAGNAFSIGVGLGDPTGIEFGFWFDNENWLDIGLGSAGFSSAVLYATYHLLLAEFNTRRPDVFKLGVSLGFGGLVGGGNRGYWGGRRDYWGDRRFADGDVRFGARVPLGLEFWFMRVPLSLFLQIGPQITNYFPDDVVTAQFGARFHFGRRNR